MCNFPPRPVERVRVLRNGSLATRPPRVAEEHANLDPRGRRFHRRTSCRQLRLRGAILANDADTGRRSAVPIEQSWWTCSEPDTNADAASIADADANPNPNAASRRDGNRSRDGHRVAEPSAVQWTAVY